ncbi:MAG TPA: hypothetical protein VIG32_04220 [Candidatus Baltobacteraceae bacterium]
MTISEHLEFSVLTTPLAAVDRRALSQAWYSALYSQHQAAPKPPPRTATSDAGPAAARPSFADARDGAARTAPTAPRRFAGEPGVSRVVPIAGDRRAARSPLARRIECVFVRPQVPARRATFALAGSRGRVQILLRQAGPRVALVAICAAGAREHVAAALAQARYALAARGVTLDARTRVNAC